MKDWQAEKLQEALYTHARSKSSIMSMRGMGCCESLVLVEKNLWKVSLVNDSFKDVRVEQLVAATA